MWSRKYNKCIICGTTERKHAGKGMCKKCHYLEYRKKNIKRVKERRVNWAKKYPEKIREYSRQYRERNPEYAKEYRESHCEEIKESSKQYRKRNPEMLHRGRKLNPEKYRKQHRLEQFIRRHNDPRYRLKCNISSMVCNYIKRRSFSKNSKSTFDFFPYTIEELMNHLENLFIKGMTWKNYGEWHIDHKIPDCKFNYKNVEDKEFQECWALKNLQPLWAIDNLKKGGR